LKESTEDAADNRHGLAFFRRCQSAGDLPDMSNPENPQPLAPLRSVKNSQKIACERYAFFARTFDLAPALAKGPARTTFR
jgi:hypothetical protein